LVQLSAHTSLAQVTAKVSVSASSSPSPQTRAGLAQRRAAAGQVDARDALGGAQQRAQAPGDAAHLGLGHAVVVAEQRHVAQGVLGAPVAAGRPPE
jgi:hypothetical protein